MKLSQEQKASIVPMKADRAQINCYYALCAALSCLIDAAGDKEAPGTKPILLERAKRIPGGARDLRLAETLVKDLTRNMLYTFEPQKGRQIARQIEHLRIKTAFGPEASKDPELFLIKTEELALLVKAATEACKVRMCAPSECARCALGKVIDGASFVSRGNRAWWEVFEQATRRDVGAPEEGE